MSLCSFVTNMIPFCTRGGSPSLVGAVDDQEKTGCGQGAEPSTTSAVETIYDIRSPERDKITRPVLEQMTALLESAGKEYN